MRPSASTKMFDFSEGGPPQPQLIPPFQMTYELANHEAICFEYDHGRYTVDLDSEPLARVRAAGFSRESVMTPLKSIRLSDAQKSRYGIPPDASSFAWACPLPGSLGMNGFEPETPEEVAAVFGAFAYFKDADHIVALTAARLTPPGVAGSVAFEGPHRLQPPKGERGKVHDGQRLREFLVETGRFQSVSVDALKQAGVEYTWWLGPYEPIAAENGTAWPHGCFIYLYREGFEQFDSFLTASSSEDAPGPAPSSPPQPVAASPVVPPLSLGARALASPSDAPGTFERGVGGIAAAFARRSIGSSPRKDLLRDSGTPRSSIAQ